MRSPFTLPEFVAQQDSSAEVRLLKELRGEIFNRLSWREKKNLAQRREVAEGSEEFADDVGAAFAVR